MIPFAAMIGSVVGLFASQKLFGKKHLLDLHWFVVFVATLSGGIIFQVAAGILMASLGYDVERVGRGISPLFVLALFFVAKWLNRREAKSRRENSETG